MHTRIPSPFKIERVDATDPMTWAILVDMDAQCFDNAAPPLTDNTGEWWMATINGEHAGFGAIKPSAQAKNAMYLSRSGVLPLYRGMGLQKKFIQARVRWARAAGYVVVVTDTHDNPASGNSLISCGFKLYTPPARWSFESALYWRRFIRKPL